MWRRYGQALYGIVSVVVILLEAAALGILVWAVLFRTKDATGLLGSTLGRAVVGTVSLTAILLAGVTFVTLTFQSFSERRDKRRAEGVRVWEDVWAEVAFGKGTPPSGPLNDDAVAALVDLRESTGSQDAAKIDELLASFKIDDLLLERLGLTISSEGAAVRSGRTLGRLGHRLDALESLAKARIPSSLPALFAQLDDPEPAVKIMAARAIARTMSTMPDEQSRRSFEEELIASFEGGGFSAGSISEAITLLDDSALSLLARIFDGSPSDRLVVVALDCTGRLGLQSLAQRAMPFLEPESSAEVRAAVLRCFSAMATLPEAARPAVRASLSDPEVFVRIQATHTAALFPTPEAVAALRGELHDESWWARRAAALGLARLGEPGFLALEEIAAADSDRYARDMALIVLQDEGRVDAAQVKAMLEAG